MSPDFIAGVLAQVAAATISLLGLIHLYWVLGGRAGRSAAIPEVEGRQTFSPSRAATFAVALALFAAAALVAIAGRIIADPFPSGYTRMAVFLIAALFLGRAVGDFRLVGFFKRVRGSPFARLDGTVYTPLCLALGVAILYVAYRGR